MIFVSFVLHPSFTSTGSSTELGESWAARCWSSQLKQQAQDKRVKPLKTYLRWYKQEAKTGDSSHFLCSVFLHGTANSGRSGGLAQMWVHLLSRECDEKTAILSYCLSIAQCDSPAHTQSLDI